MNDIMHNGKLFKLVSFTDDLYTSADADVGRLVNGVLNIYTPFKATGGYVRVGHKIPSVTNLRHRLVAMAWLKVPDNYLDLEVNHINHVRGDDWLENVEWATGSENINHAVDSGRMGNRPIYCKEGIDGDIIEIMSTRRMADHLGIDNTSISVGLKKSTIYRHPNGFLLSYYRDELLAKTTYSPIEIRKYGLIRLYRDDVLLEEHESVRKLHLDSNEFPNKTLSYLLYKHGSHLPDGYKVTFLVEGKEHTLSKDQMRVKVSRPSVRVLDILTGVEVEFINIASAAHALKLDPSIIQRRLDTGNIDILTPHHRVTDKKDVALLPTGSFTELIRLSSIELYSRDGVLLVSGENIRKYCSECEHSGIGAMSSISYNLSNHIARYLSRGYSFIFKIGPVDITDKIYECFNKWR